MAGKTLIIYVVFLLAILLELPTKANSQSNPILTRCLTNTNYTTNSPFASDLKNLVANLTTAAADSPAPFFTTTNVGSAYGLAQCRPDVSPSDCTTCISNSGAVASSHSGCPNGTSAAVRFDYCVLIYSNTNFFSQPQLGFANSIVNVQNASDVDAFDTSLVRLMDELAAEAAVNKLRYSAGIANYSESGEIYGMMQCNRDLSLENCEKCLSFTLQIMGEGNMEGKIGGQVLFPSCTLRFETSDFFNLSLVPPPPSPPPQPATVGVEAPTPGIRVGDGDGKNAVKIALSVSITAAVALVFAVGLSLYFCNRKPTKKTVNNHNTVEDRSSRESLFFDLKVLKSATNNFSDENKLGGGGFGLVYKGVLKNGQEIAVKRLSRSSSQGFEELKNEVALVARLLHKNLVRLLGFCLQEQEKLLVYEFLPNSSLDRFLFDERKRGQLDWATRYKIIEGILRGLLYLHVDSRLKIIHRDMKASNILLDKDMNAKISDFGLAKLFGIDETHRMTNRIAGTFGYMAPEYALMGKFSTKSDVYSYGILVLEIITGIRNGGHHESGSTDLLSYVWKHWNEGTALQVVDESLGDRYQRHQVLRLLHVALLCVQESPEDRPSMDRALIMLSSFSVALSTPSPPYLYFPSTTTPVL